MNALIVIPENETPVLSYASAALRELGAFLAAVRQVFGEDAVRRAAALWILGIETAEWNESNAARAFRQISIQVTAQLAQEVMDIQLEQKSC